MRMQKRLLCLVLVIILTIMTMVGCTGTKTDEENNTNQSSSTVRKNESTAENTSTESTIDPNAKWKTGDNVSIGWYLNYPWWQYNKQWTEYPVLKEVSDITGVIPNISIPSGDANEKMNLMIATNELPDMITMDLSDANVKKLITQGLLYSFDELIDKYVPEFRNEIPQDVWNFTRSDIDQKLYGLPSFFVPEWQWEEKYQVGFMTYNVRKDYYTELGSPDMSTPDAFVSAIRKFKEKYPEINGKPSIPLSLGPNAAYVSAMENSFGIGSYFEDDSHNLQIKFKDPKYADVAVFLNSLYREGLLDKETFIKKNEQETENLNSGRIFAAPSGWYFLPVAPSDEQYPNAYFIAIEPMKAINNIGFPVESRLGWNITMITKKAKNLEAAIKFIRFMWSEEGNLLMNFGYEGEHYIKNGDTVERTQQVADEMAKDPVGFGQKTGISTFTALYYPYWKVPIKESPDMAADRAMAAKYAVDNTVYTYNMKPDPTSPEGVIATQVEDIIDKEFPNIVMAKTQDSALETLRTMIEKLNKVGLPQLEKWWSTRYKKNRSTFGFE